MSGGVYALKLQGDKYYIGYSNNIEERIQQHFDGNGAGWTKMYPPVKVMERAIGEDKAYETQMTLQYMRIYGWHNVRGGPYVQMNMQCPQEFEDVMTCFRCRSKDHLIKDCTLSPKEESNSSRLFFIFIIFILTCLCIYSSSSHSSDMDTSDTTDSSEYSSYDDYSDDY
jgi:hypothetical protein